MRGGRPLRFLTVTLGGWTVVRIAMLLPVEDPGVPIVARAETQRSAIRQAGIARIMPIPADADRSGAPGLAVMSYPRPNTLAETSPASSPPPLVAVAEVAKGQARISSSEQPTAPAAQPIAAPLPIAPSAMRPTRLSGSGWTVLRGGGGGADFAGGRLGGAQAGLRLTYALGDARRFALAGRVSTPLRGRGREAALGLDWRPTRLPLHLVVEQRIALDRGASTRPAVALIGGLNPLPVAAGFRLEGYGQAGAVARAGAFADGAIRLARPAAAYGPVRIDIGAGAWGGVQRDAARLDVGPGASVTLPLADRSLRVTLDYRRRVAGRAAPGSGIVLAIGSDF